MLIDRLRGPVAPAHGTRVRLRRAITVGLLVASAVVLADRLVALKK